MNRRKELQMQYKEIKTVAGVYQIKNTQNGKMLIASTPNMNSLNGKRFSLQMGSHDNKQLQKEWKQYGEAAFVIELLEPLKIEEDDPYFNAKEALGKLEEKWLKELQPFGERGYNREHERERR
ncbi:GIY-YIG nuclease family protein [Paenibacillus sp. UNC451MF]|uniref:GIY-YIG nuclease family protein n=1 Tax=Paenibacillus sp. UNC451MF TaxID=1449063 RepID=UPI00048CBBE4|nr:GIY-YIG nuclease family protein [Paenibacillus sp. UNC451MF]